MGARERVERMSFLSRLFGGSGGESELTPEEIYQWQEKLAGCDYEFCVELLGEELEKKRPRRKLLVLFEAYKKEPGLRAAVAIVKYDGALLSLFANSANVRKPRESMTDEFEA